MDGNTYIQNVCQVIIFFLLWRKTRHWKEIKDVMEGGREGGVILSSVSTEGFQGKVILEQRLRT